LLHFIYVQVTSNTRTVVYIEMRFSRNSFHTNVALG